jgi:DNA-binding XRE family transcriptional regulator
MLLVHRVCSQTLVWWTVGTAKKRRTTVLRHRRIIGAAIRDFRKRAHFTQEDLGEAADLNPKYIGEVERGEKIISIEALLRVAKALKVPIRFFFRDI